MPIPAHDVLVKSGGMSQILLWTSFLEIFGGIALFQTIQVCACFEDCILLVFCNAAAHAKKDMMDSYLAFCLAGKACPR
jgi:hypothetical protein